MQTKTQMSKYPAKQGKGCLKHGTNDGASKFGLFELNVGGDDKPLGDCTSLHLTCTGIYQD